MKIAGIQKLTLLDFPGRCAATIFTPGCNLRCPFCHNASLVDPGSVLKAEETGLVDPDEVLEFLKARKGRLTGLAVTGGEPLIQPGLMEFLDKVKSLGFAVKLDTNGTNPERLKALITAGIVDYVAMDYKNCRQSYAKTVGLPESAAAILYENTLYSLRILRQGAVDFELRTTVTEQLHTAEDIRLMSQEIEGVQKYFLQAFVDSGDILGSGYSACSKEKMQDFLAIAKEFVPSAQIRGL